MKVRAAALAFAFASFALFPLVSGAAPAVAALGNSCFERMLREMGWDDASLDSAEALDPLPAEVPAIVPAEDLHPCAGKVQPGARMTSGCTMNFIFRDQDGALYLGTAGHCTAGKGVNTGVVINIAGVGNAAAVVYDGYDAGGDVPDFSLARIGLAYYSYVDPTMCHWGGPSGVNADPGMGETTHIYGFGNIYGSLAATRPRVGAVLSSSTTETTYLGFAQPGDSGAPLMTGDGSAFGVHVRSSLSLGSVRIDPSPKFATKLSFAMAQAEAATGLDLQLVDGTLPFSVSGGLVPGV